MKTARPVKAKHAPLLGLFLNGYEEMRQKMDESCRRPLLDIAPLAFSKWYYTALAQETILSPEVRKTITDAVQYHANNILNQLRELQIDLRSNPAVFIGGGSLLLRPFIETSPLVAKAEFVDSPAANALGYQMLAAAALKNGR